MWFLFNSLTRNVDCEDVGRHCKTFLFDKKLCDCEQIAVAQV